MSKTISDLNDLRPFGITYLTGEACRVGMRILCDVTEQGRKTVLDLLGLPPDTRLSANWNGGSGAIGSVMIPYELFPQLKVWCLLLDGARVVITTTGGQAIGIYDDDEPDLKDRVLAIYRGMGRLDRTYHIAGGLPGHGTRCTHQMSGRTE